MQTALQGEVVSQVLEGQRRFDLLVRLDEPYRTDYANLGRAAARPARRPRPGRSSTGTGRHTPPTGGDAGANQVNRENVRRRIVIRCNTQGRDLGERRRRDPAARSTSEVTLPEGYFVEYGGQFESQQRATRLIAVLAARVGRRHVRRADACCSRRVRIVLQILNALPTAFIGGVLALVLTGQTLTVASLVGFISLGGIAVRNGILLVTHYFHLMRDEGEGFTEKMVLRGSLERLVAGADDGADRRHRPGPAGDRRASSRAARSCTRWRR